ncbi:uncharacterized protein V6R79_020564 [Siganus canaliculatus]
MSLNGLTVRCGCRPPRAQSAVREQEEEEGDGYQPPSEIKRTGHMFLSYNSNKPESVAVTINAPTVEMMFHPNNSRTYIPLDQENKVFQPAEKSVTFNIVQTSCGLFTAAGNGGCGSSRALAVTCHSLSLRASCSVHYHENGLSRLLILRVSVVINVFIHSLGKRGRERERERIGRRGDGKRIAFPGMMQSNISPCADPVVEASPRTNFDRALIPTEIPDHRPLQLVLATEVVTAQHSLRTKSQQRDLKDH